MSLRHWSCRFVFISAVVATVLGPVAGRGQTPVPPPTVTRVGYEEWGIAVKHPVLQAACKYCPWGSLADVVKTMMAFYGFDVGICYTCSMQNAVRTVAKRLPSIELSDRTIALGVKSAGPPAPMDFGVTSLGGVLNAYRGQIPDLPEGSSLRLIARIEQPSYLMMAVTRASGLTDLRQVHERKMPIRILGGNAAIQEYYHLTEKDVTALGGAIYPGNALDKNENFDVIIGSGVMSNYPEGNMWYEMTMKKDLMFLPIPEEVRQRLVKESPLATLVNLPFRYMKGVGDAPIASVGTSGTAVYSREDVPDGFAYAVAKAVDEHRDLLKWAVMPFSFDSRTVADGAGVPVHPGAAKYYRERGYLK